MVKPRWSSRAVWKHTFYFSGSQLGVLAPPGDARRDFVRARTSLCELLWTKNNTSNGARGAKTIFPSGWGGGFKMNWEPLVYFVCTKCPWWWWWHDI